MSFLGQLMYLLFARPSIINQDFQPSNFIRKFYALEFHIISLDVLKWEKQKMFIKKKGKVEMWQESYLSQHLFSLKFILILPSSLDESLLNYAFVIWQERYSLLAKKLTGA